MKVQCSKFLLLMGRMSKDMYLFLCLIIVTSLSQLVNNIVEWSKCKKDISHLMRDLIALN